MKAIKTILLSLEFVKTIYLLVINSMFAWGENYIRNNKIYCTFSINKLYDFSK